jgi:hypothetical protein
MRKPPKDGECAAELREWLRLRNRGRAAIDKITTDVSDLKSSMPSEEDKPGEFDDHEDRDRRKPHRSNKPRRR